MSFSIATLLIRNLHDVFGVNDPAHRRAAIDEIFNEDCVFYEPRGVHRGNGYRAALVRRQLTPGLISSLSGTAGLPPFISFSTSYPELPPMPKCMTRRLLSQWASAGSTPGSSGTGARRGQEAVVAVLVSRHAEPSAAADPRGVVRRKESSYDR